MVPHAAVAAPHLDVLGQRALVLEAAPPRDHAVAAAVERAGGHGERRVERRARRRPGLAPPSRVEARDARDGGRAEWARERDHLAHFGGKAARQLAGIDAAQAPADEAQLLPVPRAQRDEASPEPGDGARVRPEVPPEPPAVDVVAAIAEEATQRPGRAVVREPARQHEHRVAVAAWRAREQRERGHEGRELEPGAPLEGEEERRRRQDAIAERHEGSLADGAGERKSGAYAPASARRVCGSAGVGTTLRRRGRRRTWTRSCGTTCSTSGYRSPRRCCGPSSSTPSWWSASRSQTSGSGRSS